MESQPSFYVTKLREVLLRKQLNNPQYSLRAYARDLGLDPSTLSKVLKGSRPLTIKDSPIVAGKLNLSPADKTLFLESVYKTKVQLDEIKVSAVDDRHFIDESHHAVIAEWEHFVVETLFEIDGFNPTVSEVARSLGITEERAQEVLTNLKTCGLVVEGADGKLTKAFTNIRTPEDIKSVALRESHLETLDIGKQKLEEVAIELRDFSSMTVALDLAKLPEAKSIIREFRQKMTALLKNGHKSEVYQLAIQFYPMTQRGEGKE